MDTPDCQDREQLTFDGADAPPFILWYLDGKNEGVPLSEHHHAALPKSEARETITAAVCSEIARLLSMAAADRALINGRRLLPGDIAILVRKNSEAKKMQQALTQLEIPSVLHSGEDLFSSHEAREMSLFLGAAAAPNSIRKVKTALCTSLADLGQNLGTAAENGESMEQWLIRFRTYHDIWERYGFIQMFWSAMAENRVRQRILGLENGERILTNFFHLAEVLHQEAAGRGLSMTSLLGYLHERMSADLPRSTEHQLRLESDADRIKIVTIHKAKGLEYPVVFCPFSWEGARLESKKECLFHHRKEPGEFSELIFDGGSPELQTHLQQALQEEMAENLRLLYVALTRAVHRCYLVWGPFKSAATSGLAYLLHQGHAEGCNPKESAPIIKGADRFRQLSDQDIMADLNELASEAQGTIMIAQPPTVPETFLIQQEHDFNELESRRFTGTITNDWKISSFSSLTANRPFHGRVPEDAEEEYPGLDEVQSELEPGEIYSDQEPGGDFNIFNFPHGPGPGTMLHRLLEQIDFSRVNQEETDRLITDTLLGHGYDPAWLNALSEMLGDLAGVQLHRDIPGLSLGSVAASSCLHEVEFYFPISRITPDSLKSILGRSRKSTGGKGLKNGAAEQLGKLTFAPAKGFMKGFIDLVYRFEDKYYLLDWKSNHLGTRLQDYHRDTLAKVMLSDYYFLQCNLYCFALHLYLQRRLPSYSYEKNFGGAFYVFLRGVKQEQGSDFGIYHHVPELSIMENFTGKLLGSETVPDQ